MADIADTSIYTDPTNMEKDNIQLLIWNGTKWVELSNGLTINKINENIGAIQDAVAEAQKGIATAETNSQNAVDKANNAIAQSGLATETATTAKQVADTANSVASQAKMDSATALSNSQSAVSNAQSALSTADAALSKSNTNTSSISTIDTSIDNINATMATKATQTDLNKLTGRVSTSETNISQNTKDIALKANATDVNTLAGRVTSAESSIKINADVIALKANQADVNTLTGRVSTAESNITINTNAISQKVSSSDVQNLLDTKEYATQTWTNTAINQKADSITSTVTALQTQVNNSAVGTNLLLSSGDFLNNWNWGGATSVIIDGQSYVHQSVTSSFKDLALKAAINVPATSPYTVSFNYKGSVQAIFVWQLNSNLSSTGGIDYTKPYSTSSTTYTSDSFVRQSKTATLNGGYSVIILFRALYGTANEYWLNLPKLELGSVATDYSANPADIATVTALSVVSQKADSINQTVTNNKTSSDSQFSTINQTISGVKTTVSNKADSSTVTQLATLVNSKVSTTDYNSEITQLASDINLRVKTGDLLSQINQQAGGDTLIQVSSGKGKLYLDASSVVFGGSAFITSAMISNISADDITTGTMTAGSINLGNGTFKVDTSGNLTAKSASLTGSLYVNSSGNTTSIDSNGIHNNDGEGNDIYIKNGYFESSTYDEAYNATTTIKVLEGQVIASYGDDSISLAVSRTSSPGIQWNDSSLVESYLGLMIVSAQNGINLTTPSDININSTGGTTYLTSTGNHDTIVGNSAGTGNVGMRGAIFYWDTKQNGGTRVLYGDINGLQILSGGFQAYAGGSHLTNTRIDNELWVNGKLEASSLSVSGSKNSIVKTSQGWALINAYETAEYYFGDIGKTNTGDGSKVKVMIDSLFLETVNTNVDYHVFVSSYGNGYAWISEQGTDYFIIESNVPNLDISYEVKAKRLGYEGNRLEIDKDYDTSHENVGVS